MEWAQLGRTLAQGVSRYCTEIGSEVSKHHLQFREPVKDAARDDRQQMHAALNSKSVNRPVKAARNSGPIISRAGELG